VEEKRFHVGSMQENCTQSLSGGGAEHRDATPPACDPGAALRSAVLLSPSARPLP